MKIVQMAWAALLIGGCGTTPVATQRAVNEQVFAAIQHRLDVALQSGKDPGGVWAEFGDLYMKQAEKQPENALFFKRKATSAFLISAQYGNNSAREVLRRNDIAVPDAVFKN